MIVQNIYGQNRITNPSFEGTDIGKAAPFWENCEISETTSNLQPGHQNVRLYPSNGRTYLAMVTRGYIGRDGNEYVSQKLNLIFSTDSCYQYSIKLSHSARNNSYSRNDEKVILRIWLGNDVCSKEELIWASPTPESNAWTKFDFSFTPTKAYHYIILEAYYEDEEDTREGHILIDDLREEAVLPPTFNFELGMDTTICRDENLILTAYYPPHLPTPKYLWNTRSTEPTIEVTEEGLYWAEINNGCGVFRDSIYITHDKCIFIPNVITPNGDGYNESFVVKGFEKGHWHLRVFNRWGETVYSKKYYKSGGWKGGGIESGTYYYDIRNMKNGEAYNGSINIIKE
ncbi:gliding motility-associated C-terminal domain-containing protein [Flexithrix dorotheae]|uniref:T9SS type B sorting domain-containing protein n=1 Tax=Flexithrix dorotheae TaxID=70993 RepID=UPI0003651ADD|nr:gliding motility-associated C-terminal domain-containing protein [Flexithrix dorotheae]